MSEEHLTNELADENAGETPHREPAVAGEENSPEQPPWRQIVHPYLQTLATKISDQNAEGHSLSIPIGRFNILVSPLDQELALKADEDLSLEDPHRYLIRDAMGVGILIAVSQRKFEKAESAGKAKAGKRLEKGLDFGYRLSHLMTVEMRQLRNDGLQDAAAEMQDARRRLTSIINEAEGTVEKPEVTPKVKKDSEPQDKDPQRFVYQWDSSGSASDSDSITPPIEVSRTRHKKTPKTRGPGRQRMILAVLLVVFCGVLTHLWLNRERQLQDFAITDFPEVPGIEKVINRSPVILIIVSEELWKGTDRFGKELAVASVRKKVEPAGYRRAEFRSARSSNLAAWNGGNKTIIRK